MANRLKMAQVQTILELWKKGWSFSRIGRELGIDRGTVSGYVRGAEKADSKPAEVPIGNQARYSPNSAFPADPGVSKPAEVPIGSPGRSRAEGWRNLILEKLEIGLTAQRIYQDLTADHGYSGSYDSIKRFVRKLKRRLPLPFRRIEVDPGEEMQVDFGGGAPIVDERGRRKKPWLFRIVLSHSRKGYSEVVWKQTTENFIRCMENAFRDFGGVPKVGVIDNLKAAVTRADWYDPELNPKIRDFEKHYGITILPTKPFTPRHKGKIERGVGYVKDNALKGKVFRSLVAQNDYLAEWEATVADLRIHGTIRKQVKRQFEEHELPALAPLPAESFPFFQEGRRKVHRDGHVEVERAFYSVPPEYLGKELWARWDSRMVRIYTDEFTSVAVHAKVDRGNFSTLDAHLASEKISRIERGAEYLLRRARLVGPQTGLWARQMLEERGIRGVRVLHGLLTLTKRYRSAQIEAACELALGHGAFRLRELRTLLARPSEQANFDFMDEHPLIREMEEYGRHIKVRFHKEEQS